MTAPYKVKGFGLHQNSWAYQCMHVTLTWRISAAQHHLLPSAAKHTIAHRIGPVRDYIHGIAQLGGQFSIPVQEQIGKED